MQCSAIVWRCASIACILAACLVCAPLQLGAAPLNLSSTSPGDVKSAFTQVDYVLDPNPSTGTFTAVGYPEQFDVNNQNILYNGNNLFDLTMTVDSATGNLIGGTVLLTGDTDGLPSYSGTLLTGNLIQFGFPDGPFGVPQEGNIFEFVFEVTGGVLAAPYYSSGFGGIIMNITNGSASPSFTGVFTSPFHNDGNGFSDTFPTEDPNIPEPASIILLGFGLLPLAWRLRRRGQSPA